MIDKSELRRVPAFADLPDDQIVWFISQSEEMHVKAGDTYVREGDPADAMFVILEGEFQWRGVFSGDPVVLRRRERAAPRIALKARTWPNVREAF